MTTHMQGSVEVTAAAAVHICGYETAAHYSQHHYVFSYYSSVSHSVCVQSTKQSIYARVSK